VNCIVQSGTTLAAFGYTYTLSALVVTATVLGVISWITPVRDTDMMGAWLDVWVGAFVHWSIIIGYGA